MLSRICLFIGVPWLMIVLSPPQLSADDSGQRQNLVFVMTDDQAAWTMSVYGNRQCPTPNMDRLAREGALFTNAFSVTALCSPSRASFLTGLYPTQAGVSDVLYWSLMQRMLPPDVYQQEMQRGLKTGTITWPGWLQQHGYRTALVGKWHLGIQPNHHPTHHGFQEYYGPALAGVLDMMNYELQENGQRQKYERFLTDVLTDKAIGFIERNRDQPFALLLATQAPHAPWNKVPDEDLAALNEDALQLPESRIDSTVRDDRLRHIMYRYLGLVRAVDRNLGRILTCLKEQGLDDRTIVIFTSDHGFMMGHRDLIGKGTALYFGGGEYGPRRMNMFDDSLRVPLLIRWPGRIDPGTRVREVVSNLDFFPTLLTMLSLPAPDGVKLQGMDMSPLFRGGRVGWRDALFGQLDVQRNGFALMRMIRTERWKLVRFHLPLMMDELYDLQADPGERNNLYRQSSFRETRDQLQARLTEWQRSIQDPVFQMERIIHRN